MSTEDLSVRVRLLDAQRAQRDAQQTGKAIKGIGTSAEKAGAQSKRASREMGLMGHATHGLKSALAFTGVGALAFGVKDLVTAGVSYQKQQAQLQNALGKTAGGMQKLKEVHEAIERTSAHGGFAGPEETQAVAKFTTLTGSATEALQLNSAAIDLARGGNMGYAQAQKLLSSATVGQVRGLQKLVGVITPVTTNVDLLRATTKNATPAQLAHAKALDKQATATAAVKSVTEKFGGATDAYGKTAAGAMSNAENSFDALKEKLGVEFLPTVTKGAQAFTKFVGQMQTGTGAGGEFAGEMKSIGKAILPPLKSLVQIGGAVVKFVGHHPALAKVAGDLIAVGLALKAIRFVGALTGVSNLLTGLGRIPGRARAAEAAMVEMNAVQDASGAFPVPGGRNRPHPSSKKGGLFSKIAGLGGGLVGKAGSLVGKAGNALFAYEIADQIAKPLFGKIGDLLLGKGNALTDETRRSTAAIILGALGITPDSTSAHDTVTGRNAIQRHHRMHKHSMGGLIPGLGMAGAGDTQLGMLMPGEFVLRRQVVSAVGAQNLQRLNGGGELPDGQSSQQWVPGVTRVYIGARQVAEATTQYTLKKQARRS